ncbi:MAG: Ldh family oxidoreductase [Actinomycetota bacterium]
MSDSTAIHISATGLADFVTDIFERAGCSPAEARRIADNLVEANLTGHDSHGVVRVQRYVLWVGADVVKADQELEMIMDGGAMALVSGQFGFGQTIGPLAVDLGIERCREHGLAAVALRHSGHLGRIGAFAERAAAADLVSMHIVNVANSRLVAPFGSMKRRMGTNPYAFGVPRAGQRPIVHDFATSIVAEGKAAVAAQGGPPLRDDALVGPDGLTGDPSVFYGKITPGERPKSLDGPGALRAMGDHKGSGLSVMCELLAGCLTGSGTAGPDEVPFCNGMLSIYIDPERLDVDDTFAADVASWAGWYLDAEPLDASAPVLLPGDIEHQRRTERTANGLDLPTDLWLSICNAADRVGAPIPAV